MQSTNATALVVGGKSTQSSPLNSQ